MQSAQTFPASRYDNAVLHLCDEMLASAAIAKDVTGVRLARDLKRALRLQDEEEIARLMPLFEQHARELESLEVSQ